MIPSFDLEKDSKNQHLFVIIRIDLYDNSLDKENILSGKILSSTKTFSDINKAELEAERLNKLNGSKETRYIVVLSRFVD